MTLSGETRRRAFWAIQASLLAATGAGALLLGRSSEWMPSSLVALVLGLALLGQWFSVEIRGGQLSASLIAIVLAMGLLGPVPAATCGLSAMILKSSVRRLAAAQWLNNLATYAVVPFAGGLIVRTLASHVHGLAGHDLTDSLTFGLVLFAVFLMATGLSFLLFALDVSIEDGNSVRREMRELLPLVPGELAAGALATVLALGYRAVGPSMLFAAVVVLLIFQRLTVALLRSEDRAEQLFARSRQLVGLQLGVLRTLIRALRMRDQTTARHAAAVAFYAKTLAVELGCSAEQQEMVHTAGLLHDIGKFTWPDRILHAEAVAEEDLATVQSHPQEGSILVGALDGYGEVADAILYHHERIDGRGYPAGLIGAEIPLGSRIIAVCSNYDTMTARDSYRPSMTPEEAMAELRSAATNGQLDGELVDAFITVLGREGGTFAEQADFETELEFERRVDRMIEPPAAAQPPGSSERESILQWAPISRVAALGSRALNKG